MQQLDGVEHGPLPADSPVQMRAGYAAGGSAEPDELAFFHFIAGFNVDARQVHGNADEPKAVVDHDAVAFVIERLG